MALVGFMLSNRPDTALATVKHYAAFDRLYIFAHEKQTMDFEAAWQEYATENANVEIIYHNIEPIGGQPPFGAIRFHLFQKAQAIIGRRDFAVMVDDDLKMPRWAEPGKFQDTGAQSYPQASPEIFRRELLAVGCEARKSGFHFFTGIPNARAHNGYRADEPFKAVWRFSQLLGFFKNSPNPFNPRVCAGEDYAAACKLVDSLGTLPFLEHRGLVPEYKIVSSKYRKADDPRNVFLLGLQKQHPWIKLNNNYLSGVIAPKIDKKFLNQLKRTISGDYK